MDADKAKAVCERIADGESLRSAAEAEGTTHPTFLRWCNENAELSDQYARATLARADIKFEELDDVSEQAVAAENAIQVAGLRLKADNIKWQLGKMAPKKYGDKLDMNHSGSMEFTSLVRQIVDPAAK